MPGKIADSTKNSLPPGRSPRWETTVAATVFLALAAPVLAHLLFTPKFLTNDDVCMNMIACGAGICDRPDPHLFHINFFILKTYIPEHYGDSVRIVGQWFLPKPLRAGTDFQIALVRLGRASTNPGEPPKAQR